MRIKSSRELLDEIDASYEAHRQSQESMVVPVVAAFACLAWMLAVTR